MKEKIEQAAEQYLNKVYKGYNHKEKRTFHAIKTMKDFIEGANFILDNLWQEDTDDESLLPPIGKSVIVMAGYPEGKLNAYIGRRAKTYYGKGGWNIPNVKYFLNAELPKDKEE